MTRTRKVQLRHRSCMINRINQALAAMRAGQTLHLQYREGRPLWSLSNGQRVTAEVAALLTSNANVVPAGDALFPDQPAQTWGMR